MAKRSTCPSFPHFLPQQLATAPETAYTRPFDEDEVHPKPDSRHGKRSSCGDQEIENLRDTSPPRDASQPEAYGEALPERSIEECEGKERAYIVGFDGVRKGGDAVSICSLD